MNTRPNAYEIPAVQLALMFARLATRGPANGVKTDKGPSNAHTRAAHAGAVAHLKAFIERPAPMSYEEWAKETRAILRDVEGN